MAQLGNPVASSQKALMLEMKSLQDEPVEGFKITLVNESDMYNWEVAIFGPPNTHYEGGYFKALLKFPVDYPYSPPNFRFLTKMWHPNIYEHLVSRPYPWSRTAKCAFPSCTPQWTTPIAASCLQSGGTPRKMSGPSYSVSFPSSTSPTPSRLPMSMPPSCTAGGGRAKARTRNTLKSSGSRCRPPKAKPTLTASRFPSRWRNTASAPKCQPRTTAPTCCTTTAPASCTTTTPPSCTKTTTKTRRTTTATRRAFATTTGTFVLSTRTRNMRLRIPTEIDHHPVSRTHQFCFFFPCFYRRCVNGTPLVLLISNVPRCGVWNVFLCFLLVNWFI
ncbi:cell division cycle 34 homolog a isoform X1 [Stigmatopora argus]